jgi:glutamate-1-semialdehyde 2,1-aminomutase
MGPWSRLPESSSACDPRGPGFALVTSPGTASFNPATASEARDRQDPLVERAASLFPGGVNSPVRAFRSVGRPPLVLDRGLGPRVRDADERWYIDYIGAWGPAILGHADPVVVAAVAAALRAGFALGATSPGEIALGEAIREAVPSMERLRFTSSGTEAAMSALRVARGFTGRDLIIKMAGGYHGHADGLLVEAGSGVATLAIPGSAGVPAAVAATTIVVPINDLDAVELALTDHPGEIAAIIVEPVAANVGVIPPLPGYLEGLRRLADDSGTILIFDEVITGFRVAHGGAQARYGVTPDLTVLGKIIGGGMPVGAYGGRRDLMATVAPDGPVYQAGTLSGHPLTMAAGLATLEQLRPEVYERLEATGAALEDGLRDAASAAGREIALARVGSLLTVFFRATVPTTTHEAMASDRAAYARFFGAMLDRGILLPPSQFEAWFISTTHGPAEIARTIEAAREAFAIRS